MDGLSVFVVKPDNMATGLAVVNEPCATVSSER